MRRRVLPLVFVPVLAFWGCSPDMEPIERSANTMLTEVVQPVMSEAVKELGQQAGSLQGSGSLINPGYVVEGWGGLFNGVIWKATVRLDGVTATLAGATQASALPLDAVWSGFPSGGSRQNNGGGSTARLGD